MDKDHVELLKSLVSDKNKIENITSSEYWRERAKQVLAVTTRDPMFPVVDHTRADGSWLYDIEGNKYFDVTSGVAVRALGLLYEPLVEFEKKIINIIRELPGQDFDHIPQVLLAEKLVETFPKSNTEELADREVMFTTSGSRANEMAIKAAIDMTNRTRFVAFRPAFHGRTGFSLSLTASKAVHREKYPISLPIIRSYYSYCYRCPFGQTPDSCGVECVDAVEDALKHEGTDIAGIFLEPICGEGGIIVPDERFVKGLREIADNYNAFLISDEVQAGMGRTGRWWAIENFGVIPDMITSAKAIGGGYPLGAVIGPRGMHITAGRDSQTWGGEPHPALVSLFMFREIERLNLLQHIRETGTYFLNRLKELEEKYEQVGDTRGIGFMLGMELVKDKKSKEPYPRLRNEIIKQAVHQHRLWILGSGESTIRFLPSYLITKEEVDMVIEKLELAIKDALSVLGH